MTLPAEVPQPEAPQPDLFDKVMPTVALTPAHRTELAVVVEALLREIAAALADATAKESGHE